MPRIATFTLNPTLDHSSEADAVAPVRKVRTTAGRYEPGGGGINVARVVHELTGDPVAVYFAGGFTGRALGDMVGAFGFDHHALPIAGNTRISHTVFERKTGQEYRFVSEGPEVSKAELADFLAVVDTIPADWIVASGSLPPGVPDDFLADLARRVARRGCRFVVDTSGPALKAAMSAGVCLVKPNLRELRMLTGRELSSMDEQVQAVRDLVDGGSAEIVALSLGKDGAVLATRDETLRLAAPEVEVRSAVGAGDSFVAAMTWALAGGRPAKEAFAYGLAAGTAAVLTPGIELCRRSDVERLYHEIQDAAAHCR